MRNLNYIEGDVDGVPVRYYYPKEISFFQEPDTQRMGRHVTSEFSENVLNGKINFQDAIKRLRDEFKVTEEKVDERFILEKMVEAINQKQIPMDMGISERLAELNAMLEGVERYRIVA